MKRRKNSNQLSLFDDWLIQDLSSSKKVKDNQRFTLALRLSEILKEEGKIESSTLIKEANRVFGGTQAEGVYSQKSAYDAMEVGVNIFLRGTETSDWNNQNASWATSKIAELTEMISRLPTQSRRDSEMEEFQQFSTPPPLAFAANWVANITAIDTVMEPQAGTGDLAIWADIAGAKVVLNELSERRTELLEALFPNSRIFQENAEQLNNILPDSVQPSVIVMNPPFTATAGRVEGKRSSFVGARHVEQALKRVAENGRVVAIVGQGMGHDRASFREWWKEVESKYSVRADISISGQEYRKYGTTFDNRILVIDKTGPTVKPVLLDNVNSVAELPQLLEGIKNERVQRTQQASTQPASRTNTITEQPTIQSGRGIGGNSTYQPRNVEGPAGDPRDRRTGVAIGETPREPDTDDGINDSIRIGGEFSVGSDGERDNRGSRSTDSGGNNSNDSSTVTSIGVEAVNNQPTEFTESVFANYTPQRLKIQGAQPHPGTLVQSAAMAAVEPPTPTYQPTLPSKVINEGLLSLAQLEAVVYAGQAHEQVQPNGARKGFFIGDGTGVGKGREISGVILDNQMKGRTKAVWISFNEGLLADAKRDFAGVGGDPDLIFLQGKTKASAEILPKEGILFTTYSTLRGGERKQANDLGQKQGRTRLQQIIEWLGPDFDGVIAFDESHSMANAIAIKGARGTRKPSQQAIAGINLQSELPDARVLYVSATGATEISNLRYADRLGLWGEGTAFADANSFVNDVSRGGIASMELISRDMKAMGMYLSRSLSYEGVSYERLEHPLTPLQTDIYNELAQAWQVVLNNVEDALKLTQAGKNGHAKSAALSQFWGAHQRFFNQVITAMQTPAVIDDIRKQLDVGNAAVIQLVNTNEAAQKRILADATAQDIALEELDFTPRQMLVDYVRNGFPVAAYEESTDENGNTIFVLVRDAEGNPVIDREAVALRDELLETLHEIRVPENPLDSIINAFGADRVAEVTGRSQRFVQERDEDDNFRLVVQKRGKNSSVADAEAFQANKKDILIFSGAGGTGYSFHADNTAQNQRKRIHYILQPGWQADKAVQGFGRTHRTNESSQPHYVLPTTDLHAQKRFVSSIARRLDQLGALTRGQRDASSQGLFTASDNLESSYATTALKNFFYDLYKGNTDLVFASVSKQMGLNLFDENGSLSESKIPPIPQFLNRLLSLTTEMQNAVFTEFENRLIESVEYAKQHGLFDSGMETVKALSIIKKSDEIVFTDKNSSAETRYIELDVANEIRYIDWENVKKITEQKKGKNDLSGWFTSEYGSTKGDVFYLKDIGERIDPEGKTVRRGVLLNIREGEHRYVDNADEIASGYGYRRVLGKYERVELSKKITETTAELKWKDSIKQAPKTVTKTERMLVGAILPIWDRVEGSETIKRLQTDDGEQLLGRMLGQKAAKKTLENLGINSTIKDNSQEVLWKAITNGERAILANGWEIHHSRVNNEKRIEISGVNSFTLAEERLLKEQGAFFERIRWSERCFIPTGDQGFSVFERITSSKPVVKIIEESKQNTDNGGNDDDELYSGVPAEEPQKNPEEKQITSSPDLITEPEQKITDTGIKKSEKEDVRMANTQKKRPFHEQVAEGLIRQLQEGTAPWQKPWDPGGYSSLPYNPKSGNRYKGINVIHLMGQGYSDPRWMTYRQASDVGGQVKKGEKSTSIQFWKFSEEQIKRDEDGKPVMNILTGEPEKEQVRLERPKVFYANVFNAEQIDGLPPLQHKEYQWEPSARAENILKASGATIQHHAGDRAFYQSSTDEIHLPQKTQFSSANKYYAVALHELGHWSGAEDRLNRDLKNPFGSVAYAKEELRAEIASMTVGAEVGIGHDPGQHAAYVKSWIKVLQDDPLEVFRAASDAEKIYDYVMSFDQQQEQELVAVAQQTTEDNVKRNAYQTELARLLKLSTLTPGTYLPTEEMKERNHAAVFVDEAPVMLCGPVDDPESMQQVEALIANQQFRKALRAAGKVGEVHGGNLMGSNFDWPDQISALTEKPSGEVVSNEGSGDGSIVALVLDDPHNALTTLFCVNASVVHDLDPNAPEGLDDGHKLSSLALIETIHGEQQEAAQKKDDNQKAQKIYISVPFAEKEEAKSQGARWDRQEKSWYIPQGVDQQKFSKWLNKENNQFKYEVMDARYDARYRTDTLDSAIAKATEIGASGFAAYDSAKDEWNRIRKVDEVWVDKQGVQVYPMPQKQQQTTEKRQYLAVPYGERKAAKAAGALWDPAAKSWYAGPSGDAEKLSRWNPEYITTQQSPALSPQEEFAETLRSIGCVVTGNHPVMDGATHRISVEGEKFSEHSGAGFYVGHLDGHPAGYVKNNKTGVEIKWKSKGYVLTDEQKAVLQTEAAVKLHQRNKEQEADHEAASQRVSEHVGRLKAVEAPTPYLAAKKINTHSGVYTDEKGLTTFIPIYDANGKQWSMQYVQEDGTKRIAKNSRKEGCFHVVGGQKALEHAPMLVIAEGYATAACLAETLGCATVAAIDSGNLKAVSEALHEKYPNKPIIIAGDDDRHSLLTQGINPGRTKAEEAAKAVGGKTIFPIFTREETNYPTELEPITPKAYREHLRATELLEKQPDLNDEAKENLQQLLLTNNQLNALQYMKNFTDFNDLVTKSSLGEDGLKRQVLGVIEIDRSSQKQASIRQVVQKRHAPEKQARRGVSL